MTSLLRRISSLAQLAKLKALVILFVDLCWTLIPADTTRGFLDHLFDQDARYRTTVRRWDSVSGRVLRKVMRSWAGDPGRRAFLAYLRGWRADELDQRAAAWLNTCPELPAGVRCVEKLRSTHQPFLLSASIKPVVAAASQRWELPIAACSQLAMDSQNCATGALAVDLVGRKAPAVRQWLRQQNAPDEGWGVLTDDPTDLPLVMGAREAWVVIHPRHASFWRRRLPAHAHGLAI